MILIMDQNAGFKLRWDQAAIDKALSSYHASSENKESLCEELWCLIQSEVLSRLGKKLKGDIILEEAEFAASKDFQRRLENGSVKFLTKGYIPFICDTAVRFVLSRQVRIMPVDEQDDDRARFEIPDSRSNPEKLPKVRYADLYFCMEKLTPDDKRLLELHHFEGFGLEETAKELGVEHDSARKRHSRAIIKLKQCLESQTIKGRH